MRERERRQPLLADSKSGSSSSSLFKCMAMSALSSSGKSFSSCRGNRKRGKIHVDLCKKINLGMNLSSACCFGATVWEGEGERPI